MADHQLELEKFDFVRFTWPNIHGIPICKAIPKKQLHKYWKDGIRIPAGNMCNVKTI